MHKCERHENIVYFLFGCPFCYRAEQRRFAVAEGLDMAIGICEALISHELSTPKRQVLGLALRTMHEERDSMRGVTPSSPTAAITKVEPVEPLRIAAEDEEEQQR